MKKQVDLTKAYSSPEENGTDASCIVGCDCVGLCSVARFIFMTDHYWKSLELSVYDSHMEYDWRDQLRHIWYIITKGTPYNDHVSMTPGHAKVLRDWLNTLDLDTKEDTDVKKVEVLQDTI
jgi:hypothetical protein